jgi:hypothetical protein
MQRKNLDDQETLPIEMRRYIFNFFTQPSELRHIALVNKEFNQFAKERHKELREKLKQDYKDNVFYTCGFPINIDPDFNLKLIYYKTDHPDSPDVYGMAFDFANKAIHKSFCLEDRASVPLFHSEKEAISFANHVGNDEAKPAIFKVLYLGDKDALSIQHKSIDKMNNIVMEKSKNMMSIREWYGYDCFETTREKVLPLTGRFILHSCIGLGGEVTYGHVDYDNLAVSLAASIPEPEEKKTSSFCSVM